MPFALSYDPRKAIARVAIVGRLLPDEFQVALDRLTTSTEHAPDVDTIWDLRGADFLAADAELLRRIVALAQTYPARHGCRSALLVAGDLAFGMCRMFTLMADGVVPQQLNVCRDLAEAEAWIVSGRAGEK
jgi:hypothetical protein